MNAYVDSSVVLRVVLGEPDRLPSWHRIDLAVSSELVRVECLRTLDRARIQRTLADEALSRQRADMFEALDGFSLVSLTASILERAAEPFPTLIGTLDAIHLASALLVRDQYQDLLFATHDHELAMAARAVGFQVEGA